APPPVERTIGGAAQSVRIASTSISRNASSPSVAKISGMGLPVRRSIRLSLSQNRRPSLRAHALPTVDLPEAMKPIKTRFGRRYIASQTHAGGYLVDMNGGFGAAHPYCLLQTSPARLPPRRWRPSLPRLRPPPVRRR